MASSMIELSKYRFERACEVLNDAKLLLKEKSLKSSVKNIMLKYMSKWEVLNNEK